MPPIDRDELRFVQASKQMAETGDHVDIRFQDASRYKKPVGIYWLQNAAAALRGQGACCAGLGLSHRLGAGWHHRGVATYATGTNLFGARAGLIAADLPGRRSSGTAFEAATPRPTPCCWRLRGGGRRARPPLSRRAAERNTVAVNAVVAFLDSGGRGDPHQGADRAPARPAHHRRARLRIATAAGCAS